MGKDSVVLCIALCKHTLKSAMVNVADVARSYSTSHKKVTVCVSY